MRSTSFANRRPYSCGLPLALLLSLTLMLVTAGQSLATFFIRMYASDVMLGAVGNLTLFSRATLDILQFAGGVVLVHVMFGAVAHGLAVLTASAIPSTGEHRNGLVVLWFGLLLAAILLQNAEWFPRSHMGSYYHGVASATIGAFTVARLCVLAAAAAALAVAATVIWRALRFRAELLMRPVLIAVAGVIVGSMAVLGSSNVKSAVVTGADRPNVVIVGIDSLRLQELRRFGGRGTTPNLDDALRDADVFSDTITPLARTFPSWISILTGRAPRSTGANFNLIHRPDVHAVPTIADMLRAQGYATYYSTDEVRFANIDESYGFDRVITPPIGAADFLIGRTADLPLSNVLANTRLGGFLLEYLHGNRAVADLYRPATFLERLEREFRPEGPVFAAFHLTAAHWPYYHADTANPDRRDQNLGLHGVYQESLETADAMFGKLMRMLQTKGVLDNAIVILLSDHGEALMLPGDSLVGDSLDGRVAGLAVPARVVNWGHGQSVLVPVQYQVLLAVRAYGPVAHRMSGKREITAPATLIDIVPTIADLLGLPPVHVDGVSLAPWLLSMGASDGSWRVRYTETDIRVAPAADGVIDEDAVAAQAARLFAVDHDSGWLHLRPSGIPLLMKFKERAAIGPTQLIAALPVAPDRHQYLLIDRRTGVGQVLLGRPNSSQVEAATLWDAMQMQFAGELMAPVVVRPEDAALFDEQWTALDARTARISTDG